MKLWATRETRSELMLACLRVLMGVIFLAVWADNLVKGFYSADGWADFVQGYADTTKVGAYADLLESVMIPNAALFAYGQLGIEFVVFGLFLVTRPVHAGVGAARRRSSSSTCSSRPRAPASGRGPTSSCSCCWSRSASRSRAGRWVWTPCWRAATRTRACRCTDRAAIRARAVS